MAFFRDLIICLLLFSLAVFAYLYFDPLAPDPQENETDKTQIEPIFEKNRVTRDVTPSSALPAPILDSTELQRLPAVKPPAPAAKRKKPKNWGRAIAIAPGYLETDEAVIQLAQIEPIELEKVCKDIEGKLWPCGMLARTEMRLLLRGRPIDCVPVDDNLNTNITTRCSVGGIDISRWLVLTGWATPLGELFSDELAEAKGKRRGQWRLTAP